jgi:hypothetical protein
MKRPFDIFEGPERESLSLSDTKSAAVVQAPDIHLANFETLVETDYSLDWFAAARCTKILAKYCRCP